MTSLRVLLLWLTVSILVILAGCTTAPTNTPAAIPTATATYTKQPSPTPTATSSATPTQTATSTRTPTATATPTPVPTATPSPTTTPTVSPTATLAVARPTPSLKLVYWGNQTKKQVQIGFDVEGNPKILYEILAILAQFHYHTTFFIQGAWAADHPEAVKRIVQAGHELGNHSWSHLDSRKLTREQLIKELGDTEALVKKLTGKSTKPYFRPPYSYRNKQSIEVCYEQGYTTILWGQDAYDWRDHDADKVYHNIVDHVHWGEIIYMHTSHKTDPVALRRALQTLTERGYKLVSLTEILAP